MSNEKTEFVAQDENGLSYEWKICNHSSYHELHIPTVYTNVTI